MLLEEKYGPDNVSRIDDKVEWRTSSGSGYLRVDEENMVTYASLNVSEGYNSVWRT